MTAEVIQGNRVGVEGFDISRPSPPDQAVFNAIQEFGNPKPLSPDWAIFNAAIIPTPKGDVFIARAVFRPDVTPGFPDRGVLVVVSRDWEGKLTRLGDLALPTSIREGEILNWEDPRAAVRQSSSGTSATICLTAVRNERGTFRPHPAQVEVDVVDAGLEVRSIQVFENEGKNFVNINGVRLYRQEQETHVLDLVRPNGARLERIKQLNFRPFKDIDWISQKMGVVAAPMPFGTDLQILFIHGVRKDPSHPEIDHRAFQMLSNRV